MRTLGGCVPSPVDFGVALASWLNGQPNTWVRHAAFLGAAASSSATWV